MELVAVFDNIRSMHNVGSMFRTADAVGCSKIYLCGITPGPLNKFQRPNQSLLKVALDAEKFIAWEHANETTVVLKKLKSDGFEILAIEQSPDSIPVQEVRMREGGKYVLVVGNEISGLAPDVLKLCDCTIEIPMRGKKESLNVAVAFGVAAFVMTLPR